MAEKQEYTVEQFKNALAKLSDPVVVETARIQANTYAKAGNDYIATLLRALCERVEKAMPLRILGGWKETAKELPEEQRLVQVPDADGARLRRIGNHWYVPDRSTYVYYTPEYWRYI